MKITFTGQAGFILETAGGCRVGIDLYLSDCCNRLYGLKRLMPFVFDPAELDLDLLVATHEHEDHFDPESIPLIMNTEKTQLLCAPDCKKPAGELGLPSHRITYFTVGEVFEKDGVKITAMPCDHGDEAPEAIGLYIEADGKRIYVGGGYLFQGGLFQ